MNTNHATPPANMAADVQACYSKFGFPMPDGPQPLDDVAALLRLRHLMEELGELTEAIYTRDLAKQADANLDLIYLCLGNLLLMGMPVNVLWREVQRANMAKERATEGTSKRSHSMDLVKPAGWTPPDLAGIISRYRANAPWLA